MDIRLRYKSEEKARFHAKLMPHYAHIVKDSTEYVYLQIPESDYNYWYQNVKGK